MFQFLDSKYLILFAVVILVTALHFLTNWQRKRRLLQFGDPALVRPLLRDVSFWRGELKIFLALLALACLIVAVCRPQSGTKTDSRERHGIEIMVALDVSNSMRARDIKPCRLDKAKMLLDNLMRDMDNNQIGLVVYAGDAFIQMPITGDYGCAKMFLDMISPDMVNIQGTDIARAIEVCRGGYTQRDDVQRALFVITDGEDNEGGAEAAARAAAEAGIHVYVLGIGSENGAHIPLGDGTSQVIIDETGSPVVSRLNQPMCQSIANAGNGHYIYVGNNSTALDQLEGYIDKLETTALDKVIYQEYDEEFPSFLYIAFVLLFLELFILARENHWFKKFNLFKK